MGAIASQITSLTIAYSTGYSGADQRTFQGSASLAFVRGIHRWPVNSPHKWPVTRDMIPFDDVIMHEITIVIIVQRANLWTTLVRHGSDIFVSGRCLISIDSKAPAFRARFSKLLTNNEFQSVVWSTYLKRSRANILVFECSLHV